MLSGAILVGCGSTQQAAAPTEQPKPPATTTEAPQAAKISYVGSDANSHFTKDHSFGAVKYEDLGDNPATKPIKIKNQKVIDIIKKTFPKL